MVDWHWASIDSLNRPGLERKTQSSLEHEVSSLANAETEQTVRDAIFEDLPGVLKLYRELSIREGQFRLDLDPENLRHTWKAIIQSGQRILVAECKGKIVGTATLVVLPSLRRGGRSWAELENVVVSTIHRRRGIGTRLLAKAIELARAADVYKVHLVSDFQTSEAFRFYEAIGFAHTSRGYKKYL